MSISHKRFVAVLAMGPLVPLYIAAVVALGGHRHDVVVFGIVAVLIAGPVSWLGYLASRDEELPERQALLASVVMLVNGAALLMGVGIAAVYLLIIAYD